MPGDGSIQQQLTKTVVAGSVAPLIVAAAGVVAVLAFGRNVAGAAVIVVVALLAALVVLRPGMHRVRTLKARFERANRLAAEAATVRLPEALDLARDGRKVTERQLPLLPDEHDELGELIAALDRTLRTAITVASEQARVRRQAGDMFVDLGRRHQALLGRSLELVTELERRERDPGTVADLLRLDHLVTRMRRNAESLLVLAGSEPGRAGSDPESIDTVLRAALSEIEAFDRVDAEKLEPEYVIGRSSGAVAHIIAELLENATSFSPPDSRVAVTGVHRADGYLIAVVDHGIGCKPDDLAEANQRLTQFRTVEFAPPRRLGLAVVAELARRHGIVVQLRDTTGGGTTASVLLPRMLLVGAPTAAAPAPLSAAPAPPTAAPVAPAAAAPPVTPAPARSSSGPPAMPADSPVRAAPPQSAPPPLPVPPPSPAAAPPASMPARPPAPAVPSPAAAPPAPPRAPAPPAPASRPEQPPITPTPVAPPVEPAAAAASSPAPSAVPPGTAPPVPTLSTDVAFTYGLDAAGSGSAAPAERDAPVPSAPTGQHHEDLLPRRVRGARLPDLGPERDATTEAPVREAQEVRERLTGFQAGIARARADAATGPDADAAPRPVAPAPPPPLMVVPTEPDVVAPPAPARAGPQVPVSRVARRRPASPAPAPPTSTPAPPTSTPTPTTRPSAPRAG